MTKIKDKYNQIVSGFGYKKHIHKPNNQLQPREIFRALKEYLVDGQLDNVSNMMNMIYENSHFIGTSKQLFTKMNNLTRYVEPASDSPRDIEIAKYCENLFFNEIHHESLYEMIFKSLLFRSGVITYSYKVVNGKFYPDKFKSIPLSNFTIDEDGKLLGLPDSRHKNEWSLDKLKQSIVIHDEQTPIPLAYCILGAVIYISYGRQMYMEYLEVSGQPIRTLSYEPSLGGAINPATGQTYLNDYKRQAADMGRAGWGVFPKGAEFKLHEGNSKSLDHDRLISMAKSDIEMAILHQTNTTGTTGHGSRQNNEQYDGIVDNAAILWDTHVRKHINEQLFQDMVRINFGNDIEVFPKLKISNPDMKLMELLLKDPNLKVNDSFLKLHNIPLSYKPLSHVK